MLQEDTSMVEVRSFYVRQRNALLVRGKFAPLYLDYYLHLMQHGLKYEERLDGQLKELLAAVTLHSCSRPQDETCAWTLQLHQPLVNFFVTAVNRPGRTTGRLFTEDVRDSGQNLFIAQVTRTHFQPRQSMVQFEGTDLLKAVEQFYTQSEQRLTRLFRADDEEFIMVSAEPDCDEIWLHELSYEDVENIDATEHLTPLETRGYVFDCGCSIDRLYPLIARLPEDDLNHIVDDGLATINCPRCGAIYKAPQDHFNEWRAKQPG
jgi:molecular chaperone Hsp33